MADSVNGKRMFDSEMFRWVTPIFLLVLSGIGGMTVNKLNDIDSKLFKHLTNDEIHSPKSMVVSHAEFEIYQSFRIKEVSSLRDELIEMKKNQTEHFKVSLEQSIKLQELMKVIESHIRR